MLSEISQTLKDRVKYPVSLSYMTEQKGQWKEGIKAARGEVGKGGREGGKRREEGKTKV